MSEPFLGEIKMTSFGFAQKGWALCNGQVLSILQNQALFSLLGTTFGGDGRLTFALPDLRGRVPLHAGSGFTLGQAGGEQSHTLSVAELPTHTHQLSGSTTAATTVSPDLPTVLSTSNPQAAYAPPTNLTAMASASVANAGASVPHTNAQPYLTITFSIALSGIFPSRN